MFKPSQFAPLLLLASASVSGCMAQLEIGEASSDANADRDGDGESDSSPFDIEAGQPSSDDAGPEFAFDPLRASLTLLSSESLSLEGVPDGPLVSHCDSLPMNMAVEVACYFFERGEFGSFEGRRGAEVEYVKFPAVGVERAAIVLVTGRTESYVKYAPLVYELTALNPERGYTVYVLEHRGQGFSGGRLGGDPITDAGNWQKGHVGNFWWYLDDMRTFMEDVVASADHERTYMLAHSMGGAIASRYLQRFNSDPLVDAVVLSSPMNEIRLDLGQTVLLNLLRPALLFIGREYAVGQGPWTYGSFESVTSSEVRWAYNRRWQLDFPEIRVGGTTFQWTVESYDAANASVLLGGRMRVPVLLFQAGRDQVVGDGGQNKLCSRAADCRLVRFDDAEHELMNEADSIRTPYLEQTLEFFETH